VGREKIDIQIFDEIGSYLGELLRRQDVGRTLFGLAEWVKTTHSAFGLFDRDVGAVPYLLGQPLG
jgi:hypothetical protein